MIIKRKWIFDFVQTAHAVCDVNLISIPLQCKVIIKRKWIFDFVQAACCVFDMN